MVDDAVADHDDDNDGDTESWKKWPTFCDVPCCVKLHFPESLRHNGWVQRLNIYIVIGLNT